MLERTAGGAQQAGGSCSELKATSKLKERLPQLLPCWRPNTQRPAKLPDWATEVPPPSRDLEVGDRIYVQVHEDEDGDVLPGKEDQVRRRALISSVGSPQTCAHVSTMTSNGQPHSITTRRRRSEKRRRGRRGSCHSGCLAGLVHCRLAHTSMGRMASQGALTGRVSASPTAAATGQFQLARRTEEGWRMRDVLGRRLAAGQIPRPEGSGQERHVVEIMAHHDYSVTCHRELCGR